jgi:hypothetical protein
MIGEVMARYVTPPASTSTEGGDKDSITLIGGNTCPGNYSMVYF